MAEAKAFAYEVGVGPHFRELVQHAREMHSLMLEALVGLTIFVVCSASSARDNPQTSCRGWSLPVRLRCARKTGRAQQRNTNAATGSSAFGLRIHPKPSRRSAFSQRLSQVAVKVYRVSYR